MEYEYRKQRYEAFFKERESLKTTSLTISSLYDKWALVLAGGALGFSLTFVEKIAPNPIPWTLFLLGSSWVMFITTIVLELYAITTSQRAVDREIELLDKDYNQYLKSISENTLTTYNPAIERPKNELAVRTMKLNNWSLRSLTIATMLLCSFSIFNLLKNDERKISMSKDEKPIQSVNLPVGTHSNSYVAPTYVAPPPPPPTDQPKPQDSGNGGGTTSGSDKK
jgi:hypothetical protein